MAIESRNPATGALLEAFEELSPEGVDAKLILATKARKHLTALGLSERSRLMQKAAELLDRDCEKLAQIATSEMGKLLTAARDEVRKCALLCRHHAEHAAEWLAPEVRSAAGALQPKNAYARFDPIGPILAVMPWNFPYWQVFRFAVPALLVGNPGLLKHASNVPRCALEIERIFREAGFPPGSFQTLLISASKVSALVSDPRVAAATLTGSEVAGASLAEACGRSLKKVVLELGGSDPFIVMPSADLERAVTTAVQSRILNNGQSCIGAKRFIVHESIYARFEEAFVQKMREVRVGDPMLESTGLGPLASPKLRGEIHDQVLRSAALGAKVLTGGNPLSGPGAFYEPTVLAHIPESAPAFGREELFGPVAALFKARDIAHAAQLANSTHFGLGASVWTQRPNELAFFEAEIEAGAVFFNAMVASNPGLPFGGTKRSGIGRELSREGIREFTNIKTVWIA